MSFVAFATQHGTLLDILALACSLVLFLFLVFNRRRYGAMVLCADQDQKSASFTDEVARQLIVQQSQKAYDNLQQSLTREFETFRRMGNNEWAMAHQAFVAPQGVSSVKGAVDPVRQGRRLRYRKAEEMISQGVERESIMRQCRLAESELELLQGLHQLEQVRHV